jgi:hypothetical protein
MPSIKEFYGLTPVKAYVPNVKSLPEATNKHPSLLYGVELEIEYAENWDEWLVSGIVNEPDGSLRNTGMEFITKPMDFTVLNYVLAGFFKKANLTERNYSERTSIHVHTNCQDLTFEQLQTLLMVYQIYERLFYAFVGGDRDQNIFCVPWHQTVLHHGMFNNLKEGNNLAQWQKYTGLNLLPLLSQGTIEWRHMPGHCNLPRIMTWCNIISAVYRYATTVTVDQAKAALIGLNTSSQYDHLTFTIFEELAEEFLRMPQYKDYLEEGVLDVKFSFMGKNKKKQPASDRYAPAVNRWVIPPDLQQELNAFNARNVIRQVPTPAQEPQF